MRTIDLKPTEYNEYYKKYLDKIPTSTRLIKGIVSEKTVLIDFFLAIPKEKLEFRYQADKWTLKEVLQHMIDTERIFIYRCLRIARRDKTPLTDFDQDIFIPPSQATNKSLETLLYEFETTRNNSIAIIQSLGPEDLRAIGTSSGHHLSARAAAFIIIGHNRWHIDIIKEKYL